ncbi:PREDICTED: PHD finger protein rhinoceros isoform X1 [Nicrophorus vespilloides]|uniref:PHD finger protein rhinoceros isoform X1 n=1 Tax=Nicrophorus vespilloides TaxID=110193 RepID=A0ABM1N2P5_NICVS|nr:PREDICTED: PHD finger protein rhinoceros isoform X1 [Nicrophorus vespilloides]XP_017781096.1 PREDICTED: PHD finger protein rhinoceros isoform X1 [Nicrophorus vespilloides]
MSQRVKRPNRSEDGSVPVKRRKVSVVSRPTAAQEEEEATSLASWRPMNDLKIYNRTTTEAPAELFRKDLISAMKLPDSEPLAADEYWVITDQWKQEWERGVQVPVNPDSLPEPSVTVTHCAPIHIKPIQEFKPPKTKYIRITKDDNFKPEEHMLSSAPAQAEAACSYDLDECDVTWLKLVNSERLASGLSPVTEDQLERVMERLELRCWDKIQAILRNEEGLGIEYDENVICDVCRSPDSEEGNEMVFCDSCNICVHQACYGITQIPEGQWLCCTCTISQRPDCVLCPNKGGAMKCTRSGQKWAHVSCALWIPEVSIGCVEKMEPITKISSIPHSRWALICVLCRERVGACIQCSVKTCKTAYHVTCAFKHGLEMRAIIEDENADDGVKLRSYCEKHSKSSKKEKSVCSGSDDDDCKRKKRKDMTSEEKNQARAARLQEIEAEFFKHVSSKDIAVHIDIDSEALQYIYNYWKLKRKAGHNKPLLPPKSEDVDMLSHKQEQADLEKMKTFVQLRQDLERVRNLCYMVSRREKLSRSFFKMREQTFHKQVAVLQQGGNSLAPTVVEAVLEANHVPSIYDKLYSNDPVEEYNATFETLLARIAGLKSPPHDSGDEKKPEVNGIFKDVKNNSYKKFFINGSSKKRSSSSLYDCLSSDSSHEEKPKVNKENLFHSSSEDEKPFSKKKTSPTKNSKSAERRKKRNSITNRIKLVSSSEDDIKPVKKDLQLSSLKQFEKEFGVSGSDSDELMPIKAVEKPERKHLAIYSDSDSSDISMRNDDKSSNAASDSQSQSKLRTKAAVKEFSNKPSTSKSPNKSSPDNNKKKSNKEMHSKKDVKKKDFDPSDLIVPQRQAAKKASENLKSNTGNRVSKETPIIATAPPPSVEVESKVSNDKDEQERPYKNKGKVGRPPKDEKKEEKVKDTTSKKESKKEDVFDIEKEIDKNEQDILAYVPQRQAAKKAAEHIKSGMGKPNPAEQAPPAASEEKTKKDPLEEKKKEIFKKEVEVKSKEPQEIIKPAKVVESKRKSSSNSSTSSSSSSSSDSSSSSSSDSEDESPAKKEQSECSVSPREQTKRTGTKDWPFLDKAAESAASSSSSDSSDSSRPPSPKRKSAEQKEPPRPPPKQLAKPTQPTTVSTPSHKPGRKSSTEKKSIAAIEREEHSRGRGKARSSRGRPRSVANVGDRIRDVDVGSGDIAERQASPERNAPISNNQKSRKGKSDEMDTISSEPKEKSRFTAEKLFSPVRKTDKKLMEAIEVDAIGNLEKEILERKAASNKTNKSKLNKLFSSPERKSDKSNKNRSSEKMNRSPDKLNKSIEKLNKSIKSPDNIHRSLNKSPDKRSRSSEKLNKSSEKRCKSPLEILKSPEKLTKSPEKVLRSPEKLLKSPEKILKSPEKNMKSPEKRLKSPENMMKSSGKVEKLPEKILAKSPERLPEKLQKSPIKENKELKKKSPKSKSRCSIDDIFANRISKANQIKSPEHTINNHNAFMEAPKEGCNNISLDNIFKQDQALANKDVEMDISPLKVQSIFSPNPHDKDSEMLSDFNIMLDENFGIVSSKDKEIENAPLRFNVVNSSLFKEDSKEDSARETLFLVEKLRLGLSKKSTGYDVDDSASVSSSTKNEGDRLDFSEQIVPNHVIEPIAPKDESNKEVSHVNLEMRMDVSHVDKYEEEKEDYNKIINNCEAQLNIEKNVPDVQQQHLNTMAQADERWVPPSDNYHQAVTQRVEEPMRDIMPSYMQSYDDHNAMRTAPPTEDHLLKSDSPSIMDRRVTQTPFLDPASMDCMPSPSPYGDMHPQAKWNESQMMPQRRSSSSSAASTVSNTSRRNNTEDDMLKRPPALMMPHSGMDGMSFNILPYPPNSLDTFSQFPESSQFVSTPVSLLPASNINAQIPFPSPGAGMFPPTYGASFPTSHSVIPPLPKPNVEAIHFTPAAFTTSQRNMELTASMLNFATPKETEQLQHQQQQQQQQQEMHLPTPSQQLHPPIQSQQIQQHQLQPQILHQEQDQQLHMDQHQPRQEQMQPVEDELPKQQQQQQELQIQPLQVPIEVAAPPPPPATVEEVLPAPALSNLTPNHVEPSPNPSVKSNSSVGKKSPSKPTRTSARFSSQQSKSPSKSPAKSPRQQEVKQHSTGRGRENKRTNNKSSSGRGNQSQSRGRGRGRGRGRAAAHHHHHDFNYSNTSTIHNKLVGTVYDFDFEDEMPNEMGDLRTMRERRKSADVHDKKSAELMISRDSSESPKFTSPSSSSSKTRSYTTTDLSELRPPTPIIEDNSKQPSPEPPVEEHKTFPSIVQPVLPGPVDMRTYSSTFDTPQFNETNMLGAFGSGTAEQPEHEDIDELFEKEFQKDLTASLKKPEEPQMPEVSNIKVSLSDSRNQLKVKIKGPIANYTSTPLPPVSSDMLTPMVPPITVSNNAICNMNANSGTTNLRRMRKKELLRQYCSQERNTDDGAGGYRATPVQPSLNRTIITIPKAVASMTSIPTKEDYRDYRTSSDDIFETKPRKEKPARPGLSRELRQLEITSLLDDENSMERRRSIGSNNSGINDSNKRRGRPPRPSQTTPKLKIKISGNSIVGGSKVDDKKDRIRPPKKRLSAAAAKPSVEDLKRESMKFRKKVMADFGEEKKEKKKKDKSNKKSKKKKKQEVQIIANSGSSAPKLIIRFGKKTDSDRTSSVDVSADQQCNSEIINKDVDGVSNKDSERTEGVNKVTPIKLKLSRCQEGSGYVMKTPPIDVQKAPPSFTPNATTNTNTTTTTTATVNLSEAPPLPSLPVHKAAPPLPINKDCEVR